MAQEKVVIDIVNNSVQKLERLNLNSWKLEEVRVKGTSWWARLLQRLKITKGA